MSTESTEVENEEGAISLGDLNTGVSEAWDGTFDAEARMYIFGSRYLHSGRRFWKMQIKLWSWLLLSYHTWHCWELDMTPFPRPGSGGIPAHPAPLWLPSILSLIDRVSWIALKGLMERWWAPFSMLHQVPLPSTSRPAIMARPSTRCLSRNDRQCHAANEDVPSQ